MDPMSLLQLVLQILNPQKQRWYVVAGEAGRIQGPALEVLGPVVAFR